MVGGEDRKKGLTSNEFGFCYTYSCKCWKVLNEGNDFIWFVFLKITLVKCKKRLERLKKRRFIWGPSLQSGDSER